MVYYINCIKPFLVKEYNGPFSNLTDYNWIAGKSKNIIMRTAWKNVGTRYASVRNSSERAENA